MVETVKTAKKLILDFFKDSKVEEKDSILTIKSAPKEFEEFFGKTAPYRLVFSLQKHKNTENSELIVKGSYFLSAIKDYMSNKGQTSLLKININPKTGDVKKDIKLGNVNITDIKKENSFCYIPEFIYLSNSHFLNDKKLFINKFLIKNNSIQDIDIDSLKPIEGNKEEVGKIDLTNDYIFSRNILIKKVDEETIENKRTLKTKLDKELKRIEEHYSDQIKEKDEEVERCNDKIKNFTSELKHTYYQRDIDTLNRKIKEYTLRLEKLKKQGHKERLEKEKEFHINDEIDKHTLSIDNSLINITLFYYPSIKYILTLEKTKTKEEKTISISYDSLINDYDLIKCESCQNKFSPKNNKINLCSKGTHLVCDKCIKNCEYCTQTSN